MGMQVDPTPYIWGCYLLGFIIVFGIYTWIGLETKKIKLLKSTLNKESK